MEFTQDEINALSRIKKARLRLQNRWDAIMDTLGSDITPAKAEDAAEAIEIVEEEMLLVKTRQEIIDAARDRENV